MKLLVGRFVLGCISAVLILADAVPDISMNSTINEEGTTSKISVIEPVTEISLKSSPDSTPKITLPETTSAPDKNTKIFNIPSAKEPVEREIVVITDQSAGGGHHDHDHHGYHDHHDHDYHHQPVVAHPPTHHHHDHHHVPPPHHHQHYPPHYPGYYPPPPHYGSAMPPPYPYYPPPTYYSSASPHIKPSATVIQTTTTTSNNPGQNFPKPTDLLNQGTDYLWNLFGKLGSLTRENHEVVLINPKPIHLSTSGVGSQVYPPNWYPNKVKIVPQVDCNNKKE